MIQSPLSLQFIGNAMCLQALCNIHGYRIVSFGRVLQGIEFFGKAN